jgi:hypothetical protein
VKPRLLGPQGRAVSGRCACYLPVFVDVDWPQRQCDHFVMRGNAAHTVALSHQKTTRNKQQNYGHKPSGHGAIPEF